MKVSIIIATYNSGKTIRTALDSVLNQKFQDWECLVVDGASKDDTLEIVKEFEQKDSRFRHISEPDKGIYDAFNKGWRYAKGEWVHYLGSDDRLTDFGLGELFSSDVDDTIAGISGNCYIEKIDGSIVPNYPEGWSVGCHQGKVVRRSVMDKYHGFDESYPIMADYDLMLRLEEAGEKIMIRDSFVSYFAMDGASQSLRNLIKRTNEKKLIYINHKARFNYPILLAYYECVGAMLSVFYRRFRGMVMGRRFS